MATVEVSIATDIHNLYVLSSDASDYSVPGNDFLQYQYMFPSSNRGVAYGATLSVNLPTTTSTGTITDIYFFNGPAVTSMPPGAWDIHISDLSIDAATAVAFLTAETLVDSMNAMATIFSGDDMITGSIYDDVLAGFAGADNIAGSGGEDTVTYGTSTAGVTVSLATGKGSGGDATGDILTGIENLTGSAFRDTLVGDGGDNRLTGGSGNDTLIGGAGADTLDGGNGIDTISYAASANAVAVDLSIGFGLFGDAQGDIIVSIENLIGSSLNDDLIGSVDNNRIQGMAGGDIITGIGGNDTLIGGDGGDSLYGDEGSDTLNGDDGDDYLYGGSGVDRLNGGDGDDTLEGNDGADVLTGGAGNDIFHFLTPDGTVDSIRDWNDGDRLQIDFTIAGIDLTNIVNGTTTRGLEGEGIFYNSTNGRLYAFDSESDVLTHFATLATKPASLDAGDFLFV